MLSNSHLDELPNDSTDDTSSNYSEQVATEGHTKASSDDDPAMTEAAPRIGYFAHLRSNWRLLHTLATVELALLTATVLVGIYSLSANIQRQHEMKTIDLMGHFQDRYDELMWEVADDVTDKEKARNYFDRYWNLQLEQYEYWKQGLIADDIYLYWMGLRRATYRDDNYRPFQQTFPEYTYQQGWMDAKQDLRVDVHPYDFREFMEAVMTTDRDLRSIFKDHKLH